MRVPDAIDLTGLALMGLTLAFLFLVCALLSYACGWERGRVRGQQEAAARLRAMRAEFTLPRGHKPFRPEGKGSDGDD